MQPTLKSMKKIDYLHEIWLQELMKLQLYLFPNLNRKMQTLIFH